MSRFKVLFKSTAVRLSALYILLFAICAATLVFYVTAMSERLLTGQIRDAVRQEVEQVQRAFDTGGMNLLLRTMERRARQPGANLYIIAGPSGDILAKQRRLGAAGCLRGDRLDLRALHLSALYRQWRRAPT